MKSFLPALALSLICLQVQQVSAAELTAHLILQNFDDPGAIYVPWQTNTSSANLIYHEDNTVPNAAGNTSARYGNLRVALEDQSYYYNPPPGDDAHQYYGKADPQASWSDTITISNAALTGTGGHFRPALRYAGSLQGFADADAYRTNTGSTTAVSLTVALNFLAYNAYFELDAAPTGGIDGVSTLNFSVDSDALAASNGVPYLDVPFVFGQPFTISALLTMTAYGDGGGIYFNKSHQIGYAQLKWLTTGKVFDANSNLVDYTVTSESGIDWALPQNSAVPVLQISGITISDGTNVVINGTGGLLANPVVLLTSTNVALPMVDWVSLSTNFFDFYGGASFTNAINLAEPQRFFRLFSE